MVPGGWIKIHRQITLWEWYDCPAVFCLFMHLLLMANWEQGKWHGKTVKVGQLVTSRDKLAQVTGLSIQNVRTAINKLRTTGEITTKATNQFTLITICNYDKYQCELDEVNQPTNQPLTINQPSINHNIRNKEIKNKRIFIKPTIQEVKDYCSERGNGIDAEQFIAYYDSCNWMRGKTKIVDWKAAVRTWEKNYKNYRNESNNRHSTDVPTNPDYTHGF